MKKRKQEDKAVERIGLSQRHNERKDKNMNARPLIRFAQSAKPPRNIRLKEKAIEGSWLPVG